MRLLIVEDSQALAESLRATLEAEGHACDHAADGAAALRFIASNAYDLLVLDWMLPGVDGLGVLRALRAAQAPTQVLMLSARDTVADRVAALDAGADDYLSKPFALDELLARVRALARRPRDGGTSLLHWQALQVDTHARRARWQGQDMQLSPKEYALLELLLRQRGKLFTRAAIFDRLYDSTSEASDKVVEVIISTLRGKLHKAGAPDPIATRRGFGYVIE